MSENPHVHTRLFNWFGKPTLPVILQTEAAECGLACLAMVASFHGLVADLPTLRRRFPISLKGTSLKGIIGIAKGLHLTPRPVKLDLDHLKELKTPALLHWDMNHFVVLRRLDAGRIYVHDPAIGEMVLTWDEFGAHFTGVAVELTPDAEFRPNREVQHVSLGALMGRVTGLRRGLLQIFSMALALEAIAILNPFFMQWVVDHALVSGDRDLVTVLGMGFLLLVLLQTLLATARTWVIATLSVSLNFQWLGNVFAHLLRLPVEYFEKRHLGDIASRFGSVTTIQKTLTTGFVQAVVDGLLAIGTLCMMFVYSVTLSLIVIAAMAAYMLLRYAMFRPLLGATSQQIIHAARQQTHFLETARGIQAVRLFGREEERRISWMNILAEQFNAELRMQRLQTVYQLASTLLSGVERVIVIWLAALAVLDGKFSAGMLFAFIAYKDQFSQRVVALIDKAFELRMLKLHGQRVADIVLTEREPDADDHEIDLDFLTPSIELKGVSFRYSPTEPFVLEAVDLRIDAGECVALVGASGGGKTTLVKLLLGLLVPTQGEVLIGGVPARRLGLSNFRKLAGTVMQDDSLFHGSIADNICFFDPHPDLAHMQLCAQMAAIHEEVCAMPMGYSSLVSDAASSLSGGQRQRILFARALYKRPKILVLDEATSHLDIANEQIVNENLKQMALTRIIVAHRPETIAMASRVLALEQGTLVDVPVYGASQDHESRGEATAKPEEERASAKISLAMGG